MTRWLARLGTVCVGLTEEALLLAALGLVGWGLWQVSPSAACVVTGAVVLWIVVPPRGPFIVRPQPPPERRKP